MTNKNVLKQTILVIGNISQEVDVLSNFLMDKYNILTAFDGDIGLYYTEKHDIGLILIDVAIPEKYGFEILTHFKESEITRHIPVILISESISAQSEITGFRLGAADYIRKPFDKDAAAIRIDAHLKIVCQIRDAERSALIDALTGLNNRRSYENRLETEWKRAARNETCLSLIMLDIDNFKRFNDRYGHSCGDDCLKSVAGTLADTVKRSADCVFRWGGEEFAVLLPETPLEGAILVAEQIRKNIASSHVACGNEFAEITVSAGVSAIVPPHQSYPDGMKEFREQADKALYRAKANGRNRVELWCWACCVRLGIKPVTMRQ